MRNILNRIYLKLKFLAKLPILINEIIKFELYRKNKINIDYYLCRSRYGQFLSGTYLFYIQCKSNSSVIYISDKKYFKTLKLLLSKKNIYITRNLQFYDRIRFKFKNQFSENFHTNYQYQEVIPVNSDLVKINIYNLNTKYFIKLKQRINGKKVILIAIKEKSYYQNNPIFKNYQQPDFEFDYFDRFVELTKYYCDKGYFVIRVGCNYNKANFLHENFCDYASSKSQNFENDILIANISDLVISNQTGFDVLPVLWFKKPLIHFTIRNYRFMLDWPGIHSCPMLIYKNGKLLNLKEQIELESKLWSKTFDQNEIYLNYQKNNITLKKIEPNEIIRIVDNFIINNTVFYDNIWSVWHEYNDEIFQFLNRDIPSEHHNKMINVCN